MELDPLFTDQRWKILQNLAYSKFSPLQLAEKTDTTISNVSQQLKLLEAANIVKKEKVQNRDKGKPRSLFSLSRDYAYIVSIMDGFVEKRLFDMKTARKAMLKIWFMDDEELQQSMEHFYSEFNGNISKIDSMVINRDKRELVIGAEKFSKDIMNRISRFKSINIRAVTNEECRDYVRKNGGDLFILLDKKKHFAQREGKQLAKASA